MDRTWEDVDAIFEHTKLDQNEVKPVVQCLSFQSELDNECIKLMEIDQDILQTLSRGDRVVVRGDKSDTAVLCTRDKTYEIRGAETSNSMLILPACLHNVEEEDKQLHHRQIVALKYDYYEIRPIKPRLKKLQHLLEENKYSGWECEKDEHHQGKKYTFDELLENVQGSISEIERGLHDLQACQIDEFWRMLDFDYVGRVLGSILSLIDEQSWKWEEIMEEECCDILQDLHRRNIVWHVLNCFCDEAGVENSMETVVVKRRLSEDKVCRFYAEMLLRSVDKFNFKEFQSAWQMSVPGGMNTSLYQLEGLALIDQNSKPGVIRYFPVSELAEDVNERFNCLFRTKEKWSLDEITPYVKDLCTAKQSVGAILTKHARASTLQGIRVYSSRKPLS